MLKGLKPVYDPGRERFSTVVYLHEYTKRGGRCVVASSHACNRSGICIRGGCHIEPQEVAMHSWDANRLCVVPMHFFTTIDNNDWDEHLRPPLSCLKMQRAMQMTAMWRTSSPCCLSWRPGMQRSAGTAARRPREVHGHLVRCLSLGHRKGGGPPVHAVRIPCQSGGHRGRHGILAGPHRGHCSQLLHVQHPGQHS